MKKLKMVALITVMLLVSSGCAGRVSEVSGNQSGKRRELILATTTSTYDTGLLDELVAAFGKKYKYQVKTLAIGTGEALAMGERGEVDVLLVHAPAAEAAFMAAGHGTSRKSVMYNWFLLVGPKDDPANVRALETALSAFTAIAENRALFISRGDNSGTHLKELTLWQAGTETSTKPWYQEAGQGMAATLRIADEKQAYTLTDAGTFHAQRATLSLQEFELRDAALKNAYSVIVTTQREPELGNRQGAEAFSRFITGKSGQRLIERFGQRTYGRPLFIPSAD